MYNSKCKRIDKRIRLRKNLFGASNMERKYNLKNFDTVKLNVQIKKR